MAPREDSSRERARAAGGQRHDLVHLPGGNWGLWRRTCIRAAGFPAATVLRLSAPASRELALRVLTCRTPETVAAFREAFGAERRQAAAALRDIARDDRFREAVIWQNHAAYRHAVGPLAGAAAERLDSAIRKKELAVASYVQRYSVKNDTIGFFGPVGWGRFSDGPLAASVQCGESVVASRDVYFEGWCIDEIARQLDRRAELCAWRVPRVPAPVRLEGAQVVVGSRTTVRLSPDEARVFSACDGIRSADRIAREIRASNPSAFQSNEEIFQLIESWQHAGYLMWSFEGPRELQPERTLRRRLEAITDERLRNGTLSELGEFEALKAAAHSAASPDALERALEALESHFSRTTGVAATRSHGRMYAARTLVHPDCRRDAALELGTDAVRRLGPPLTLILSSVRWAVHELARRYASEFQEVFDSLAKPGERSVTLPSFFARTSLAGGSSGAMSSVAEDVRAELQRRWTEVLTVSPSASRAAFRSEQLRSAVRSTFGTSGPPPSSWAASISPDILIDASNVEAIRRGEYRIVLGEIHPYNTLPQFVFLTQCPDAAEIMSSVARDWPVPRIHWLTPKDVAPQRVLYATKPDDYVYISSREPSPVPASRTLRVSDLAICDSNEGLVVQGLDGLRVPCGEFFGYVMMRKATSLFSLLSSAPHRPRVTIDDLVVCREAWQIPVSSVEFAARGDDWDRFLGCQEWAHEHGIPQYVFTKMPNERKPVYLDLSSPLFVDLFARSIRTLGRSDPAAVITVTEMLPEFSGVWFPDAVGHLYTSELRIVAVDPFVCDATNSD